nr:ParA family protein [Pedobacter sp. ASV2]
MTLKKPLKISFSTPKGGVGKTTLTTLVASVLHFRLGYNVLILDCDFPQNSLVKMRDRDLKTVMQNTYHKKAAIKLYQQINKKAYSIIQCKAEEALQKSAEYVGDSILHFDFIFFDLPGTANTKGVLTTLTAMDFIFAPITADRLVVESTLTFVKAFLQFPEITKENKEQSMWLFWNQVDGRERSTLYDAYQVVTEELELNVMHTRIMDSKRFRRETEESGNYIFRSSLLPPEEKLMRMTRLDLFIQEFLKIVKR